MHHRASVTIWFGLVFSAIFWHGTASACSASNDAGDTCSISCQVGQAEMCINGAGASTPQCYCTGSPTDMSIKLGNAANAAEVARLKKPAQRQLASSVPADAHGASDVEIPKTVVVTDVGTTMSGLLQKYGPVNVTTYHMEQRPGPDICRASGPPGVDRIYTCHSVTTSVQVAKTSSQVMTASNFAIVSSSGLRYEAPVLHDYPQEVFAEYAFATNCMTGGAPNQSLPVVNVNLSKSYSRTFSVNISKSFSNGGARQLNGGVSAFGVNIGGSIQISQSATNGTATTDTAGETFQIAASGQVQEPWRSKSLVAAIAHKIGVEIPFSATAVIDGDLSPNDKGFKHISDVLDTKARTFEVIGTIFTDMASQADLTFFDPKPVEASDCVSPGPLPVRVTQIKNLNDVVSWKSRAPVLP
nr:hypothetical protein HUO10_003012 [Paraburkholderia busanensis]